MRRLDTKTASSDAAGRLAIATDAEPPLKRTTATWSCRPIVEQGDAGCEDLREDFVAVLVAEDDLG